MRRTWSFGRKITAALLTVALFAIAICGVGIYAVGVVRAVSEEVVSVYAARMLDVAAMRVARERRAKHVRSYLLSRDVKHLAEMRGARDELLQRIADMERQPLSEVERDRLRGMAEANTTLQRAWDEAVKMREGGAPMEAILRHFEEISAEVQALDDRMNAMFDHEADQLAQKRREAAQASSRSTWALAVAGILASGAALGLAWLLARALRGRVGRAVERLSAAATELQSDAEGQASSSKELAATTAEMATTMRELATMSRQIAESAKRTAHAAEEAGGSARSGDETVKRAGSAIADIKRQVERIVGHMLDLGRRSQQIGGILEVINELADQTNILAINATIEAAGAGEAGKRFSLVAMEIRRLADRVGGAAREIRGLVDRINEATGTTVSATESGSRAALEGAAQFGEVLAAFEQIADSVALASSVAKEIELGMGQQVGAVEQVSTALVEVASVASESERSARTTLSTSARLAEVSGELAALIRPGATA
jgi:methyl-accepting chemotaxis protein